MSHEKAWKMENNSTRVQHNEDLMEADTMNKRSESEQKNGKREQTHLKKMTNETSGRCIKRK